ncbi:hypothetical protein SKAU_G00392370 [Synaphobranchus kaupii]|uniref:Uncharacterized protein n=1 Tax=Synaphobranchus kaupii TaxID=118154 RepID=A0A9Q1ICW8_SYNKA|nr:hypothetical protein SKAU_G00392370 [Synaphobranchus kaupii]
MLTTRLEGAVPVQGSAGPPAGDRQIPAEGHQRGSELLRSVGLKRKNNTKSRTVSPHTKESSAGSREPRRPSGPHGGVRAASAFAEPGGAAGSDPRRDGGLPPHPPEPDAATNPASPAEEAGSTAGPTQSGRTILIQLRKSLHCAGNEGPRDPGFCTNQFRKVLGFLPPLLRGII